MTALSTAIQGKGLGKFLQRGLSIAACYGITPGKIDRALAQFAAVLRQYECSATFPITAVVLARNARLIDKYHRQGIEFAIHGYRHIDYHQLPEEEQAAHIALARRLFDRAGLEVQGFRGPYLHANSETLAALSHDGLLYDSSQAISWPVGDAHRLPAYERALRFYGAVPASEHLSLPTIEDGLVRIPYSLPDDEALVHRLALQTPEQMSEMWVAILRSSHELGELFTLGLHPERTSSCLQPLTAVLAEAKRLEPAVWIAQLGEIAAWWRARSETQVDVIDIDDETFRMAIQGPPGITVLGRGIQTDRSAPAWANGYRHLSMPDLTVRAPLRPFVGCPPATSPQLRQFLQQQGYIVQVSEQAYRYAYYLERDNWTMGEYRSLLADIEAEDRPLIRLGRWPHGARSALAITGDIDALTLWDYSLRVLGN